jgi:ectoine hydroxylase-related dioxygenase (phytanoyl-CoA dioxygenase family)
MLTMLLPATTSLPLDEPLGHFREHGWARLGPVMSEQALAATRRRADQIMLGEIAYQGMFFQHDAATGRYQDVARGRGYVGPSLRYRKIEKLERDPLFLEWIGNALFERVARAVIGERVALCRAVLFTKAAQGGTELPWHQDGGSFWGLSRDPALQIWTALDDAPEAAGCVELVPGSHRAGLATPLGGVIPDDVVERKGAARGSILVPARAGEVLLLHNHVWHRSGINGTGLPRRALTVCYMDASTTCTRRRSPRTFMQLFARG